MRFDAEPSRAMQSKGPAIVAFTEGTATKPTGRSVIAGRRPGQHDAARGSFNVNRRKPAVRKPAAKSKAAPKTVAEYLARVPRPARSVLTKMRAAIRPAVPRDAIEIISYGIPAFKEKKVLVWFAAFSDHCSLFPTPQLSRSSATN
jgi:hypothetical protein